MNKQSKHNNTTTPRQPQHASQLQLQLQFQIQQLQLQPQQCKCIDFLKEMPLDSEYEILTYLTAKDLCACSRVSHRWNELADHPTLWQNICKLRWRTKKHKCFEQMELEDRKLGQNVQGENKEKPTAFSR